MSRVGGQAPHGTKDKGGSKSRKKARATLKQERKTKKAKQAGGTAK